MSTAFDSIKQGLSEAITHAKAEAEAEAEAENANKPAGIKLYYPQTIDVLGLRDRLGFTQEQFAARFGFSVATLRHWERSDRSSSGASLVLLNVIDRNPRAVMQALS